MMDAECAARFVEGCDQIFASIFAAVEHFSPPEDRYLLLADLLGHPDHELVCAEASERRLIMLRGASTDLPSLQPQLDLVSIHLASLFADSTYTVASYWSPLDGQRRSIFRRRKQPIDRIAERSAAAVLFYASTFVGAPSRWPLPPMTSIIQYMSEGAPSRPGFTISFEQDETDSRDGVFAIPSAAYSIWHRAGVADLIAELAGASTARELDTELFSLINGSKTGPSSGTLRFVARLRANCRRVEAALSEEEEKYLERARIQLNSLFRTAPELPLERDQILFFAITSQLWRLAVGSEEDTLHMHVFPVAVGNTCCVLTMGTREPIDSRKRLELSHLARGAFVQPLVLDFRTNEKRGVVNRNNNAFRRILGHNLPKILIQPGMNELVKMSRIISGLPAEKGGLLEISVRNLQLIFEHYEGFLTSVMCSDKLEEQFDTPPSPFGVDSEIWSYVRLIYDLRRDSLAGDELALRMALEMDVPKGIVINGHKEFLREVLFIVVTNAVEALHPPLVKEDPSRGILSLTAVLTRTETGQPVLNIEVTDRAGGFDQRKLEAFQETRHQIAQAERKEFWTTVSRIIEEKLPKATEGHLGIGLIFCLAYLRSLEWAQTICRAGTLQIVTRQGYGTVVKLEIPGVGV